MWTYIFRHTLFFNSSVTEGRAFLGIIQPHSYLVVIVTRKVWSYHKTVAKGYHHILSQSSFMSIKCDYKLFLDTHSFYDSDYCSSNDHIKLHFVWPFLLVTKKIVCFVFSHIDLRKTWQKRCCNQALCRISVVINDL